MMNTDAKILVTGASGMVGRALVHELYEIRGCNHVLAPMHSELDLTDVNQVENYFAENKPEFVFHAAAKVGGICANDAAPAEFIVQNLRMQTNVITLSAKYGVERLLFFGSSCAYPKFAACPVQESSLLTGELENTNRAYAIAKIAGIEMCDAFRIQHGCDFVSCMPTNLYGIGDHYHLENSHVLPGMIRRIHEAAARGADSVTLWGTGEPTREFLWVDDLATAAIRIMTCDVAPRLVNITSGEEVRLSTLAQIIKTEIGFKGEIIWDTSRPDGTPRRALDNSGMKGLGWAPRMTLTAGVEWAYSDFLWQEKNLLLK